MHRPLFLHILRSGLATFAFFLANTARTEDFAAGLILDLDADRGVTLEDADKATKWENQIAGFAAREFVKRDEGRKEAGSGRPALRKAVKELNGHNSLVFLQQELTCLHEDAFDSLSQGNGSTWMCVMAAHQQRVGLEDVNSFFGNLRNGENYEGLWGCLKDDNTLWWGARNGITFGRFDANNPQLLGPKLEVGKFVIVAGRLAAGTGKVKLELFVNGLPAVSSAEIPVNAKANPSRLSIGQERDAINHPGHESFDGEFARFLIWSRPLSDAEMTATFTLLGNRYGIAGKKEITPKALPMKGETLEIEGHQAFLILPPSPAPGPIPWIWYAPTLQGLPGPEEKWMFEKFGAAGIAIAGVDVGESYGSPTGRALFTALYKELTENRGLSRKPVFLPRSRGGLMAYNWAAENADKVGGVAGIYPVCNLESYPGLDKACGAYGLSAADLKAQLTKQNPIERLADLAKAGVKILHIHGDVDVVVPLDKNSGEMHRRYKELGGQMEIIIPKGQGHNMWVGFFKCQELVDFAIARAKQP